MWQVHAIFGRLTTTGVMGAVRSGRRNILLYQDIGVHVTTACLVPRNIGLPFLTSGITIETRTWSNNP